MSLNTRLITALSIAAASGLLVGCMPKLPSIPEIPDIPEVEIPEIELPAVEIPDVKPSVSLPSAP